MATRVASGKVIEILGTRLPEMMGGSADLAPSTHTNIAGTGNFEPEDWAGRNMHFGIRENAMGAILNGMALHSGLIPYGGTFFVFCDYMRPPMRLAAMNALPVIYIFTHDSIGMGEDGPTHQPVEQLVGLRSIPGMVVLRPADANETVAAWRVAIGRKARTYRIGAHTAKSSCSRPEPLSHHSGWSSVRRLYPGGFSDNRAARHRAHRYRFGSPSGARWSRTARGRRRSRESGEHAEHKPVCSTVGGLPKKDSASGCANSGD